MLDDVVFAAEMTLLEDRFSRRALTTETKVRYYEFLARNLTTDEFQVAAQHIFDHDQFWPSPQRFVDAVRGNAKQLAETEWQEIMRLASSGSHDLSRLSDRAAAALKVAGGMRAVMFAEGEFSLEQKRKRFVDAYQAADSGPQRQQLGSGRDAPVLPGLELDE